MKSNSTRSVTNYLKGVVILTVVLAHWNNWFGNEEYATDFLVFVADLLVIYFILSGYGIKYSLERRLSGTQTRNKALLKYYIDRGMRLFPLYWLALIIVPLSVPGEFEGFLEFKFTTVAIFLGAPMYRAPQLFYFITSLIQCYLLAPVLFLIQKKLGDRKFLILNLVFLVLCVIISLVMFIIDRQKNFAYFYKSLLFGHVSAFAMGMMLPGLIEKYGTKLKNNLLNAATFLLFIVCAYLTMYRTMQFAYSGLIAMPLLILSALFFCSVTIANDPYLLFRRSFELLGKYSYSIYLFHPFFIMTVLAGLGLLESRRMSNLFVLIASLPIFVLGCIVLQKVVDRAVSFIDKLVFHSPG